MKKYKFILPLLKKMRGKIGKKIIGLMILTVIISIVELSIPYITKLIFDKGIQEKNVQLFIILICSAIGLYILKSFINIICNKIYAKISNYVIKTIESDVFNRLIRMPISFFDKYENGYIVSRMNEVENIRVLFSPMILRIVISLISFFGAAIMIVSIDYKVLILVGILTPVLYLVSKTNTTQLKESAIQLSESVAEKFSNLQTNINAIRDVKGLNIEKKRENTYQFYIQNTVDKSIIQNLKTAIGNESVSLFAGIADVFTLFLVGILIIDGKLGIGDYIAIVGYIGKVFSPVQQIASLSITIQPAMAALTRIAFFYNNKTEDEFSGKEKLNKIEKLEFKNVTFSYPESNKVILRGFSFTAKINQKIVIMGENGTGKSSIANLILGFYKDYTGQILINDDELRNYNIRSFRKRVGIISQKLFLFPGTIEENITIGLSDIKKEWFDYVIDICDLKETLKWAKEYNFIVTEDGTNLSGGQIQRIAIARAIICKPDILILDEVNNNLDEKAQKMVFDLIEHNLTDIILIIITHDKRMQKNADQLITLDNKN